MSAKRLIAWIGFAYIAAQFAVRLPLSFAGALVAVLVVLVFAPRE